MDPFSAIGLAGNIVTFLDLGYKLLSESKTIYKSASGASERNDELASAARQLQDFTSSLWESSRGSTKDHEVVLHKLATECGSTSLDLLRLLDDLKAKNPKSVRGSLIAAFRDWRKKDEKEGLRLKLDCHRNQLNLQIATLMRAESLDRLNKLITYGKASGDELRSLTRNIDILRSGSNVSCLSPDALYQIRSLLGLTEEAVMKIRQARILSGLRFVSMTERFEDIEEAHERTFHWLLDTDQGSSEDEVGKEMESVKNPSTHEGLGKGDDINETGFHNNGDPSNDISVINRKDDLNDDDNSSFDWSTNGSDISDSETSEAFSEGEISQGDSQSFIRKSKSDPISDRVPGPFRQVMMESRDLFVTWLRQGNGIFHISGKAGSGKSTLMKYICQQPRTIEHLRVWADDKELVIGRFFFWKPGSTLQKSFKGLVRGLLYCFLSNSPELIPIAFPEQWEASLYTEVIHIEHYECRKGFEALISPGVAFQTHKFALFIDGLDEFEGEHANFVRMLFDWVNNTQSVKICVSSREWIVFHEMFRHCPKIHLHHLTYSDVRLMVQSRLRKMSTLYLADPGSGSVLRDMEHLEEAIVVRSEGVFLWAILVIRHIEEGLENGDQVGDLIKVLKTLPTDLEHMFGQLLDSISPSYRRLAYTMLNYALSLHQRHITTRLMQYAFLDDYIKDKNFAVGKPIRMFSAAENAQRLDKGRKRVYGVCKGFLELRPQIYSTRPRVLEIVNLLGDAVFFTHRSIVEFLESRNFKEIAEPVLQGFEPLDAYYYTYLGVLRHVNLPSFYFAPKLKVLGMPGRTMVIDDAALLRCAPGPSFMSHIGAILLSCIDQDSGKEHERLFLFLDDVHRAISGFSTKLGKIYIEPLNNFEEVLRCPAYDFPLLFSAYVGFWEYISYKHDITPELVLACINMCFFGLVSSQFNEFDNTPRLLRTLKTLFGSEYSVKFGWPSIKPTAFDSVLASWCCYPKLSCLPLLALMLYSGIHPGFSINFSKTRYINNGKIVLKIQFRVELPSAGEGDGVKRALLSAPELPDVERRMVAVLDSRLKKLLAAHGHTLTLRTLVSIWFSDHASVLQEVIDWILDMDMPMDTHYRSLLQSKFDPLLRPLFDEEHPNFTGWSYVPGSSFEIMTFSLGRHHQLRRYSGQSPAVVG